MDLSGLLFKREALPERPFFYYRGTDLFACRIGNFKAHFATRNGYGQPQAVTHRPPLLFNLAIDPSEKYDVAASHPEVLQAIQAAVAAHQASLVPGAPQVDDPPAP